ncbi:SMP-30/gluconolactonase/LRE family protein [Methylobacterium pseudosasicola]|uniref:Gluconolactonase n=1 Tax=Methylobacterium pseudosasicola TaxID=582667 RepID=A0A1I4RAQ2_9HYPH|nr:SMP-30/gluconolactonase/LRE family protein [Methylobacterium pseudosasicola]SFM49374.1 gluconolactonase [Methylobacterium pseudosasicola]
MYAAPPICPTRVFATYPEAWRVATAENEWIRTQPGRMPIGSFLEGPSFDLDGNLWCVDIPNGRILCVAPDGGFTIAAEYDGWPNGLKIHRDGRIFIADYKNGIMVVDPASGTVRPFLLRVGPERFRGVNDLFFSRDGDLYFTDQGLTGWQDPGGRLFRVRADGVVTCILDGIPSPNGLVMNLTEDTVYLAVTRANAVWRIPLMRDGTAAKVGTFIQMSGGAGPDGLALDAEGRIAVAHAGKGAVWLFDATGEPVLRITSCAGLHTTNVAFGGADGRALFITESGSGVILRADLQTPGHTMFSHTHESEV